MTMTSRETRKTSKTELPVNKRQQNQKSWTFRREFIPFFGLILVVLAILAYYLGTTQHITIQGHLVNLKTNTVIQYFENTKRARTNTGKVTIKSSKVQENTRHQDRKGMKITKLENNGTIKISERSRVDIILSTELKTERVKRNQSQTTVKRNTTLSTLLKQVQPSESHRKALFTPTRRPKHSEERQNIKGDLHSKVSSSNQRSVSRGKEKFNFDSWHQERTVEICGTGWQEKYRKLHAEILSKRREEKYLVYLCPGTRQGCCGYGNRLRAVVSLFYLSILTDRAFLIDWRAPEPIENHLMPRNIQWNYSEPADICTGLPIRKHYWGTTKTDIREAEGWIIQDSRHFKKWLTTTDLENYFDWPVEEITTIWYFAEGGITLNPYLLKRAKELGVKPLISNTPKYNLIGCAFDFLFTKSETVANKLNDMRKQLKFDAGPVIGVHIRTGDDQFDYYASDNERTWNSKNISQLLKFFDCARKVESKILGNGTLEPSKVRWFVSTDNTFVRKYVQDRYPRKVITSNLTIQHLDILQNTSILNFTAECNYTDSTNTTMVCYNVEIFNVTAYCENRTKYLLEAENNSTVNETGLYTDGIIAMLVDHFLLAESDFLILCDSSFGSTAVGLSMRNTGSYTLADRGCVGVAAAQKNARLRYFGRR